LDIVVLVEDRKQKKKKSERKTRDSCDDLKLEIMPLQRPMLEHLLLRRKNL